MNPTIRIFSFFSSFPRRISDLLFGYDVFISYAHNDGSSYAKALAAQLTETYTVHLDTERYHSGQDLRVLTRIRVRNSRLLVVVGTQRALTESYWVRQEVEAFFEAKRTPIIIDIDGAVTNALQTPKADSLAEWIASQQEVSPSGETIDPILREIDDIAAEPRTERHPAPHIAERVKARFIGDRVERRRLRVVTAAMLALLMTSVTALTLYAVANQQRSLAEERLVSLEMRVSELAANAALGHAELGQTHLAIEQARRALPYRDGVLGGHDQIAIAAGLAAHFSRLRLQAPEMTLHIRDAAFSPDGNQLVTAEQSQFERGNVNQRIALWDADTGAQLASTRPGLGDVFAVEMLADQRRVLAAGRDGPIEVWNLDTDQVVNVPIDQTVLEMRRHPSAALAAIYTGQLLVLDVDSGSFLGKPVNLQGPVDSFARDHMALHPDGRHVAFLSGDNLVIHNFDSNQQVCSLPIEQGDPVSLSFSADGRDIAVATSESDILSGDMSEDGSCEPLTLVRGGAPERSFADNFCGRGQVLKTNLVWNEGSNMVTILTREQFRIDNAVCARTIDWVGGQTVSIGPVVQDLLYVEKYQGLSDDVPFSEAVAAGHNAIFLYPKTSPGGYFLPKFRFPDTDLNEANLVPPETAGFPRDRLADVPRPAKAAHCPQDRQIFSRAHYRSQGQFLIAISGGYGIFLSDIESCVELAHWPILNASDAMLSANGRYLLVSKHGRSAAIDLGIALLEDGLPLRLARFLSTGKP